MLATPIELQLVPKTRRIVPKYEPFLHHFHTNGMAQLLWNEQLTRAAHFVAQGLLKGFVSTKPLL